MCIANNTRKFCRFARMLPGPERDIFVNNTIQFKSFRMKVCTTHRFVAQRQLNFIFIVPGDVVCALLTEFLTYDNAIAFSISIYKYPVFLTRSLNIGTRVFDDMNGNKCEKGRHVQ